MDGGCILGKAVYAKAGPMFLSGPAPAWCLLVVSFRIKTEMDFKVVVFEIGDDHFIFPVKERMVIWPVERSDFLNN